MKPSPTGKHIILGVTGSIAAYKAVGLLRLLIEKGVPVQVVMTESATKFMAPLTFEVLSGNPTLSDLFEGHEEMKHLSLMEEALALLIAPCTANTLAKLALGLADNLLGTMALTAECPLVVCPAMDGEMWNHPSVQAHVRTLRNRGALVIEPEVGPLASGQWGKGRLAHEDSILSALQPILQPRKDWQGERVLISAGPTQEPIDPVRFMSNGSTGKMGYALAEAAECRGAEVVLVTGPTNLTPPKHVAVIPVMTADDMLQALTARFEWATTLIMAAAVGDFRPKHFCASKLKKEQWNGEPLDLERTPDILLGLSAQRSHQRMVGFAAETEKLVENGQKKLAQKHLDMLIVNQVGGPQSAFGNDSNEVVILTPESQPYTIPRMGKRQLADDLLDRMIRISTPKVSQDSISLPSP